MAGRAAKRSRRWPFPMAYSSVAGAIIVFRKSPVFCWCYGERLDTDKKLLLWRFPVDGPSPLSLFLHTRICSCCYMLLERTGAAAGEHSEEQNRTIYHKIGARLAPFCLRNGHIFLYWPALSFADSTILAGFSRHVYWPALPLRFAGNTLRRISHSTKRLLSAYISTFTLTLVFIGCFKPHAMGYRFPRQIGQ